MLYVAVGNPVPDFFGGVRMGKNLYTAAMIVLDARIGNLLWFRQFVPHDMHDWDLRVTNPLGEPGWHDRTVGRRCRPFDRLRLAS